MTDTDTFDAKAFLQTLTHRPGCYRMIDGRGEVIYVGKARDLKRRVASYFTRSLPLRTHLMVSRIRAIEITVTHTEAEALILENNLIKALQPRYNVLLRDDKGYPFIFLSADEFPRLALHRGARKEKGRYFGPYPNAGSLRETLQLLQKLFPVRQCEETFYKNRTRPCLQHQIKRCTAPCVGLVTPEEYARDVHDAVLFLEGRTGDVVDEIGRRMEAASTALEFEQAAHFRDQIVRLRRIQERQYVSGERGDLDLCAVEAEGGIVCVQVFFIRGGRNLGNKAFFPKTPEEEELSQVLAAFLAQYYLGKTIPREIICNLEPDERDLLEEAFNREAGATVRIQTRVRGERARWLEMAVHNAKLALHSRLAGQAGMRSRMDALQEALGLDEPPARMECFDISHTRGEKTVASCVVWGPEGALKHDYRRFNISGIAPGDDYAAMEQALTRRYTRIQNGEGVAPDILFIDGGKGQLGVAQRVLEELAVSGVLLLGIAKGVERKPGLERLFLSGREEPIILPSDSPALHLIQQVRDEAHRFAITGHRQRREQSRGSSTLEEIPGVGPKRRQLLLRQFGGLQEIARAGVEDLMRVEGIHRELAQKIYDTYHSG